MAEIQPSYKSKVKASLRPRILFSRDVQDVIRKYWNEETIELYEQFKIRWVNYHNKVIGIYEISSGGPAVLLLIRN